MLRSFYVEETLDPGPRSRLRLGRRWTRATGTQRPIFRIKGIQQMVRLFIWKRLWTQVQGLLGLKGLVGRFGGKKVHWTFFWVRLTPSSA